MDVGVLQRHLSDLAGLLRQAGASQAVAGGVSACAEALRPFTGYSVEKFAAFLMVAEEYHRAGLTPDKLPKAVPAKALKDGAAKPVKLPAAEVIDRVGRLYQDILNPSHTPDHIDRELALLDGLTTKDLLAAADRIGVKALVQKLKVDPMRDAIKRAVRDRRGIHNRPNY